MQSKSFLLTKIFRNIFINYIGSVSILIFFYSLVMVPLQKEANIEAMHSEAKTLAGSISLVCADAMISEDDSFIIEHNMEVMKKNSNIYKIIVAKRFDEYLETEKKTWKLSDTIDPNLKIFEQSQEAYSILDDKVKRRKYFHYVYPIDISGIQWGWIHISYSLDAYYEKMNTFYKSIFMFLAALFVAIVFVSYSIARYMTKPILKLRESANLVSRGDLSIRVDIDRDDEIGELAYDFNVMIERLEDTQVRLKKSHFELEQKVNERTAELIEKTKELEVLNTQLDIRIKDAVVKNTKQEQMLIQQSRLAAMGEMIGNIAHQWRQPLNALGLILQNLYYAHESGDLSKEYLERSIQKGQKLTENMSKTIDDFRNFFQPNKKVEQFNISISINDAYNLISASFRHNNIALDMHVDTDIEIEGYPNEFAQVLLNILTNAKDALLTNNINKPSVIIEAFKDENTLHVSILDNAGGINDDILNKIFDPYFTTKEKDAGTGIGLYMSKMIIENSMHGKIFARNKNEGAEFIILLPLKVGDNA